MSDGVLLRFLANGLIDVGGDDAKLEKLSGTAEDLAAALKKSPARSVPFALVAFDPNVPADDPVVREAIEALRRRWATYVNTFSGTPVAVLRALLLDALVQAAQADDRVAVAFITSARNSLPFIEAGDERAIWGDVVGEIEQQVDARAEAEWATPSSITVEQLRFEAPSPVTISGSSKTVDVARLSKEIEAAAGPNNNQGATEGNPYWPRDNAPWLTEFGRRLADTIAEAVDITAEEASAGQIDLSEPLQTLAQAVSGHVDATLAAVSSATAGLQRRADLLWWKEALYSPSARIGYRELPLFAASALMAFDLYQQVPIFSPASVASFLWEAVLILPSGAAGDAREIRALVEETQDVASLLALRKAAAELVPTPVGRGPVLGLIGHSARMPAIDTTAFVKLVGVPAATPLTAPAWAAWIFRELQAARATQEGAGWPQRLT